MAALVGKRCGGLYGQGAGFRKDLGHREKPVLGEKHEPNLQQDRRGFFLSGLKQHGGRLAPRLARDTSRCLLGCGLIRSSGSPPRPTWSRGCRISPQEGPTRFGAKTSLVVSRPKDKVALCVARSKKTVVSAVDRATPATGVTHFRAWPRGGPASRPRPAATRPQPAPLPASPRLTPASSSPAGARPESGASPRGLAHHHPHPEWPHTVLRKTWGDGAMRRGGLRSRGFPRRLTVYPRAPLVSLPFCRTPA